MISTFAFLAPFEGPFLLAAAATYMAAMLLFWVQLFFWPALPQGDEEGPRPRRTPADMGRICLWFGASLHLASLAGQGPELFMLRAGNVGLFGWFLIVTYLMLGSQFASGGGAIVTPVAMVSLLYSLTAPRLHAATPPGGFDGLWLATHIVVILAAYVALSFAFVASLLYLVQEGLLKRKRLSGLWLKLPPLQVADEWIYRATAFGMALLTMGIFTAVLYLGFARPDYQIARDPKVLFSMATWLTFAVYLASRLWLGWHGRKSNLVVIYGFVLLVISFLGSPHLVRTP